MYPGVDAVCDGQNPARVSPRKHRSDTGERLRLVSRGVDAVRDGQAPVCVEGASARAISMRARALGKGRAYMVHRSQGLVS